MCNRTVGLVSRVVEFYGIPTISLSINRSFAEKIPSPRNGFIKFPYGAPFGEPGHANQHLAILRDLFHLLQKAKAPGEIIDLPHQWKRTRYKDVLPETFPI